MLKAMLVDDEHHAIEALHNILASFPQLEIAGKFTDPREAMKHLQTISYDVVFLDIEMPGNSGLDLAEKIMEQHPHIRVVLVTAYSEYAVDAFEANAIDYLLKPVRMSRMKKTIEKLERTRPAADAQPQRAAVRLTALQQFQLIVKDAAGQDQIVKWRTQKTQELFAYLVHHGAVGVHKTKIMADMLPEMDPEAAATYIHTCIYQIRKTIRDLGLSSQFNVTYVNQFYFMEMSDIQYDVDAFLQTAARGSDGNGIGPYVQACELYRGHYMEDNGYSWAIHRQQQLLHRYVDLIQKIALFYVNANHPDTAIVYLEAGIVQSPLHEPLHEMLLAAYAASGNRAAFAIHYDKIKKLLWEELGVMPGQAMKRLAEQQCLAEL